MAAQHTFIREEHSVVIAEGLYLLRREEPWTDTSELFDLTIFIESDIDECISRLKVTHNLCAVSRRFFSVQSALQPVVNLLLELSLTVKQSLSVSRTLRRLSG